MAEPKTAEMLSPPGQRGGNGNDNGMQFGGTSGWVVVTHLPAGKGLGKRLNVPTHGLVLGGRGTDIEVEGADRSRSRVEVMRGDGEFFAEASGQVTINREKVGRRILRSGDDIRIDDSFFRFLCGQDAEGKYHETVYGLTIRDFPTGLANARYMGEALEREWTRAARKSGALAVASVEFEQKAGSHRASHNVLSRVADRIVSGMREPWVAARGTELEVVVLAPDVSGEVLAHTVRGWLRECEDGTTTTKLGIAELSATTHDGLSLLAAARSNIVNRSG